MTIHDYDTELWPGAEDHEPRPNDDRRVFEDEDGDFYEWVEVR